MTTILVTGATGTIGSQTIEALQGTKATVRAGVRSAAKAEALKKGNVTPIDFDYERPETFAAALKGVDTVFLLTPFSPNQVELAKGLVDAAKNAGVKRIVKLSATGADIEPGIQLGRWHRAIEKDIEASGLAFTFLRPSNFMQNFIGYYPPDKEGAIYLPFGTGAVSSIDAKDVGAVAAKVLAAEGADAERHAGKAYELSGPAALTVEQVASAIGGATGRTIRYVDVPEDAARKAMLGSGAPEWMTDAMMELHAVCKAGYAAGVNDNVAKILGREPRTFATFAKENAAAWKLA